MRGKGLEKIVSEQYGVELIDLLTNWYWIDNLTQKQIASKLGVSTGAICENFKKYDIKKREKGYWMDGFKHSDDAKEKISQTHKGKVVSTETKKKMSAAKKGKRLVGKVARYKGIKTRSDGYIQFYNPDHPFSNSQGYVMEHRLVMENKIGRILNEREEVHHINEIRNDNRPENLHLFKNKAAHMYYHMMKRHGEEVELKYEYQ